jgi:integrase
VLALEREQVEKCSFSYKEQKSGKTRRVRMSKAFAESLLALGDPASPFIFPSRFDTLKHRSRQAVYKDIRRAAKAFRLPQHVSPHTARKVYAVNAYKRTGSMKQVQQLLNHSSEAVTMLYALADQITARELEKKNKKKGGV